jgi:hypothetical protein
MSGKFCGLGCRKALFNHVKNTSLEGGARGQKAALNREFKGFRYLCLVMRCSQDVSRICGTQAAMRMFGDSNKSLKPNSRMPRMVDRYNWKVTEMARWMTRRIQRSRARCQRAVSSQKDSSVDQRVGPSKRESVQVSTEISVERR